jgi:HSP90 family molecular chaperone
MFHEESLITTIFKILNVVVLAGAGFYFFKTRIVQQIRDAIVEKKDGEKALQDEKRSLKTRLKMINDEIIKQQEQCARIKDNVVNWNAAVNKQQTMMQQEKEEIMKEQETRVQQQSEYLTALKIQKKIVPQALADAQDELEREFTPYRGHAYMQTIVGQMRRRA